MHNIRHLHEDLPQDVREKYVLKGHFIGKTGHHIDRRLNKRDLLRSEAVLNRILQPMIRRIMSYRPTALLGQETAAALLVRRIGGAISIPAFSLPKTGDFLPPEDGDMSRAVLVEDNVITAQSIREALGSLRQAPATPIRAITLFDSSGGQAQDFNEIPIEAVYDVGVRVWDPQTCICLGTLAGDRAGVEVTR